MEHLRGESSRVGLQMGSECRYVFVLEWGDLELVVVSPGAAVSGLGHSCSRVYVDTTFHDFVLHAQS